MKRTAVILVLFLLLQPALVSAADLKLAALFSDHMVLQRDKPVPVWGWAEPGEQVTVAFGNQTKTAKAGADGKWMVKLEPLETNNQPQTLTVTAGKQGSLTVKDVLVGEVWLGSGQSNMAMTVNRANNYEEEQAAAKTPQIRMFKESSSAAAEPAADAQGTWTVCSPQTVGGFSATLFFFGRELHRELKVPIGLINSSVGGTPIESWVAAEVQAKTPELKESYQADADAFANFDEAAAQAQYEKQLERWKVIAGKAKAAGQLVPRKPTSAVDRHHRRGGPGYLFNGKIAPLAPYAIRGAVWYQGEANSSSSTKGELYYYQLGLLVSDWRERWGEDFPFAWVQLPNFNRPGEGWSLVRESMLKTLELPKTGMAITVDIGDASDIHPKNKQDVGRRLAMWALGDVYGVEDLATSGPLPTGHEVKGSTIVVSFTHTDDGLVAKGGKLKGFEIAGADGEWHPAQAEIEGDKVVVSSVEVKKPAAARYAWTSNPDCNLYNGQGLPATPFRTSSK